MVAALLERLAISLGNAGIPYMVVGGQAVGIYGEPRFTKDIDVTLGVDVDRLQDVLAISRELALSRLAADDDFVKKTRVLPCQDQATGLRVDFIFSFSAYEAEALSRTRPVRIGTTQESEHRCDLHQTMAAGLLDHSRRARPRAIRRDPLLHGSIVRRLQAPPRNRRVRQGATDTCLVLSRRRLRRFLETHRRAAFRRTDHGNSIEGWPRENIDSTMS